MGAIVVTAASATLHHGLISRVYLPVTGEISCAIPTFPPLPALFDEEHRNQLESQVCLVPVRYIS